MANQGVSKKVTRLHTKLSDDHKRLRANLKTKREVAISRCHEELVSNRFLLGLNALFLIAILILLVDVPTLGGG